jgi:transcription antitermination factor NusG
VGERQASPGGIPCVQGEQGVALVIQTETEGLAATATVVATGWCVAHTKSRQEKALIEDLDALGIPSYLPLVRTVRYYGRRKVGCSLPLFPGYVFLCGSRADLIAADRTKRVVRYIKAPDPERLRAELESVKLALESGGELIPTPLLRTGVHVEITSGPFRGVRGVVASMSDASRVVLNVDLIGRAAALEIERDLLRPVEAV